VGSRKIWDDNIKINVETTGCNEKDCIPLNQKNVQWGNAEDHIINHQVVTVKLFFCLNLTKQNITQKVL
jgi:hypothetical protein